MTTLAIIAAIGLVGLGIEIAVAIGLGRCIHHGNPITEHQTNPKPGVAVVIVAFPRIDVRS